MQIGIINHRAIGKKEEEIMSLISRIIRKEFKKNDDLRDSGLTTPEEILRFDDIV